MRKSNVRAPNVRELQTPLGTFILRRRMELGITLKRLAEQTGLTTSALIRIEAGAVFEFPDEETLAKLASALEVDVAVLRSRVEKVARMKAHMKEPGSKLGRFIRERRLQLGLTQGELARRIWGREEFGSLVSNIERGKRHRYEPRILASLAEALNCNRRELEKRAGQDVPEGRTALGRLIRSLREERDLTRGELAERMGVGIYRLNELENRTKRTTLQTAQKLTHALGCDPSIFKGFLQVRPNEKKPETALGKLVRERRHELQMSQKELSDKIGITRAAVSLIELGRKINLSQTSGKRIAKLAEALKLEPSVIKGLIPVRWESATELGRFVLTSREALGLTRSDLAQRTGLSDNTLWCIEKGSRKRPLDSTLFKIADVLGCDTLQLFRLLPAPTAVRKVIPSRKPRPVRWESATELGRFIISRRKALGLTRQALARKAGLSYSCIWTHERYGGSPTDEILRKLAAALECDLGQLIELTPSPPSRGVRKEDFWRGARTGSKTPVAGSVSPYLQLLLRHLKKT